MADIEERTLSREIDPAAARAVLASKQWRAAKLNPKKYSDKVLHAGDPDGTPIQHSMAIRFVEPGQK